MNAVDENCDYDGDQSDGRVVLDRTDGHLIGPAIGAKHHVTVEGVNQLHACVQGIGNTMIEKGDVPWAAWEANMPNRAIRRKT